MVIIFVDYIDFQPETYQGVSIHRGKNVLTIFTGNPVIDFRAALTMAQGEEVFFSSTVDDFGADSGINLRLLVG